MKVFLCADIEGTAGIAHWDEAERLHKDYSQFQTLMTNEVIAACEGARAAGAKEVLIKDAHDSGRNILLERLPSYAKIIRGWSGHPDAMMFGLSEEFDAAIFTGHHAKAGSEANPLAHTTTTRVSRLLLNSEVVSEFTINALCAARYKVPCVFLAGDSEICGEAKELVKGINTVETLSGFGRSSISITPQNACEAICAGVEKALSERKEIGIPALKSTYELVVEFTNPTDAYRASWYPLARHMGDRSVAFSTNDFFEVQRAIRFLLD